MANSVSVDASNIERFLDSLNDETQKEILMKGLKKAAKLLQENTRSSLISKFPKSNTAKGKANKTMVEGVSVKANKDYTEVSVSVMNNYLNIFYENGTEKRFLKKDNQGKKRTFKKGEYRGQIKGLGFFMEARQQSETPMTNEIENTVFSEINKIFNQ